jgi:hypothetical protein
VTEANKRNRTTLLAIAGIPVFIILAATGLWYSVSSGGLDLVAALGTANKGRLLDPPVALAELDPRGADGRPFKLPGGGSTWHILLLGGERCEEECRHLLYYTRQIHTAMGKYTNRIERVYLATGVPPGDKPLGELAGDYPQLNLLYTSAPATAALLQADESSAAYFVMDPEGWVILSYSADADGKDIMADLKFLLKNSNG